MSKKWFRIGMVSVFLLSLALRFWGLGRFNTLVFDEVYYAKFAHNYLSHTPFFDGHPPLGKYIIAIGIWISDRLPFWHDRLNENGLTGSLLPSWGYRWLNALFGSFLPLIVAAIAYQLSYRRSFALLAGLFTACDGIFLVESRYALINQYIVIFGLLGHLCFLLSLKYTRQRSFLLILAGVAFGASIATKWNGLLFLVGIYLIWILAWVWQKFSFQTTLIDNASVDFTLSSVPNNFISKQGDTTKNRLLPLQKLTQIHFYQLILYLGIIPVIIYSLVWIPHLQIDQRYGFIEVHKQILSFHEGVKGNTSQVHPYCAPWYTWPWMIRPIAYFYQKALNATGGVAIVGPPLPPGMGKAIYDVHAMGNPVLWWLGLIVLLYLAVILLVQLIVFLINKEKLISRRSFSHTWIALYLVINYGTNLLPWAKVSRCVFIYHYMPSLIFAFLAIAWFVDRCLHNQDSVLRILGITIISMVILALIFWMPIYLGLPLSPESYNLRMPIKSWI